MKDILLNCPVCNGKVSGKLYTAHIIMGEHPAQDGKGCCPGSGKMVSNEEVFRTRGKKAKKNIPEKKR